MRPQVQRNTVREVRLQAQEEGQVVGRVCTALQVAVALEIAHRAARADLVRDRQVLCERGARVREVADFEHDVGIERVARPAQDGVDHSTHGAATVQRALRPRQELDALDIDERRGRHLARDVDAVDIVGIRRLDHGQVERRADAADVDLGRRRLLLHTYGRYEVLHVCQSRNAADPERVGVERRHGRRYTLKLATPLVRGYHDLVDRGGCRAFDLHPMSYGTG